MNGHPVSLAEGGRLFGFLTVPSGQANPVGVIILNAGLLHNVGPFRLHVDLSRRLANLGIASIRLDQSSKGESERKLGADRAQSMLDDYDHAAAELAKQGVDKTVLIGLCSGADDASYISVVRESVIGMAQLDGYACRGFSYAMHHFLPRIFSIESWIRFLFGDSATKDSMPVSETLDAIDIRDWPSDDEMIGRLVTFLGRGGKIISVFTSGQNYYNSEGQLQACLPRGARTDGLRESYNLSADHTYSIPRKRQELIDLLVCWVEDECLA